jgi:hypothetical protein
MCDYSLENVASRPAKAGDRLVSTKFANAITRGFSSIDDPAVAVCLLPGTEIAFEREVSYYSRYSHTPDVRLASRVARFRQVDLDRRHQHHDALEFSSGEIVYLARLAEGQTATVIQLPHVDQPVAAHEVARQLSVTS